MESAQRILYDNLHVDSTKIETRAAAAGFCGGSCVWSERGLGGWNGLDWVGLDLEPGAAASGYVQYHFVQRIEYG